jgi:hypothetical protein
MPVVSAKPPSLADVIIPERIERLTAIDNANGRLNRLGVQIVNNYFASGNKYPGGECIEVTWDRVMLAAAQASVLSVYFQDKVSDFGRLWYSHTGAGDVDHVRAKRAWLNLPWVYRGAGAAGAMAYIGLASLVDVAGIWAGKLQPGAVMQAWNVADDYYRVRDGDAVVGDPDIHYGHSFIFLNYVRSDTAITGMSIADNGFRGHRPFIMPGEFAIWFGANHNSGVPLTDLIY